MTAVRGLDRIHRQGANGVGKSALSRLQLHSIGVARARDSAADAWAYCR